MDYINQKASKRLFYLRQLKYAGLSQIDLIKVYKALIRSICEYACPVWSTGISKGLSNKLESIQKRAVRIILPFVLYDDACNELKLATLLSRRRDLCHAFFKDMTSPTHRLNSILPQKKNLKYGLRSQVAFEFPRCKTNRYKIVFYRGAASKSCF